MRLRAVQSAVAALAAVGTALVTGSAAHAESSSGSGSADVRAMVRSVMAHHPGGTQVAPGVVSWYGGKITYGARSAGAAAAYHECAYGYYCFYTDANYQGSWWQWSPLYCDNSVGNFADWAGMNDRISSWMNKTTKWVVVYRDSNLQGGVLWEEPPVPSGGGWYASTYVGGGANDQASSFNCPS